MKRQIRRRIFESNSSSMHAIVVMKDNLIETQKEIMNDMRIYEDGVLKYDNHELEFGRSPFECLCTFESKVRYAFASFSYDKEKRIEIEEIIKKNVPKCKEIKFPTMQYYTYGENGTFYGYVDENVLGKFLISEGITLEDFIVNKRYIAMVDGDEYCIHDDLKRSGLINKDLPVCTI